MSTEIKSYVLLLSALVLTGCAPIGLLYSKTVVPSTQEYTVTPIGTKRCVIKAFKIKEPVTGYSMVTEWSTSYLLAEAQKAGIRQIYYLDKRTLSIFLGIYKHESIIVYGD